MTANKKADEMDEAELAEFYEKRAGDVSLWQKKPRLIRSRKGKGPSTSFAVRFAPEELEQLQAAAAERGVSLSDFIRTSSLRAAAGANDLPSYVQMPPALRAFAHIRDAIDEAEREMKA